MKKGKNKFNAFVEKHWKKGVAAIGVASLFGLSYFFNSKNSSGDNEDPFADNDYIDNNVEFSEGDTEEQYNPRYKVERKSLTTGEWYTKTETDYINSAYSSLTADGWRTSRLIDTVENKVLANTDDPKPWIAKPLSDADDNATS